MGAAKGRMGSRIHKGSLELGFRVTLGMSAEAWSEGLSAILPKRLLPTRLETRTKESTIYASVLAEKPTREMKVRDAKATAASTDHDSSMKGLSKSISVRTRKMVNYA